MPTHYEKEPTNNKPICFLNNCFNKVLLSCFLPYVSVICIKIKGDFMLVTEGWYLILSFNSK